MVVQLLHSTPLGVAAKAIRKCWASEDKSDTTNTNNNIGPKDRELIERVGNKNKHKSTLEHLVYTFDIDGISRACLQEVARHRIASYSVKSTRYTLKELKDIASFTDEGNHLYINENKEYCNKDLVKASKFLVMTNNSDTNRNSIYALCMLQDLLKKGISNDQAKYCLPESYKTSLVMTINARSLQNFLELRSDKAALWEIRKLAHSLFDALPSEHKYLFTEFIKPEVNSCDNVNSN